ncbi:unnamed protein product [Larinioides sclopetarius]|uniref:Uncharacterized protein n=1 Tax=Larinioides sclopetarius TaxID=280406 RepID=A0AAV1YPV5_9ARAC
METGYYFCSLFGLSYFCRLIGIRSSANNLVLDIGPHRLMEMGRNTSISPFVKWPNTISKSVIQTGKHISVLCIFHPRLMEMHRNTSIFRSVKWPDTISKSVIQTGEHISV